MQIGTEGIFWAGMGVTRFEHNRGHLARLCWAFFPGNHGEKIGPMAPKVEKRGQSMPKHDKIGLNTITFFLNGLEQRQRHPGWLVWLICQTQNVPKMVPRGPISGPNMLKIAFWPNKLAQRAHFGWEGVEQGWNTTGGIWPDHVGPFFPGENCETVGPQALKSGKNSHKYDKIGWIGLNTKKKLELVLTRLEYH